MALDMRSLRIGSREERGQSVIEVALLMPLLLVIVLGVVDIGRTYAVKSAVTSAAREAALYAARDPQATADAICQRAVTELANGSAAGGCTLDLGSLPTEKWRSAMPPAIVTCERIPAPSRATPAPCGHAIAQPRLFQTDGAAGSRVTVTVRADVSLISLYLVGFAFGGNPITVSASATFAGLAQ
jgi:Flp pilus assembly protein TadG